MSATAPLAGVRVVDFTRFVSGPYATMLLAALGADVVKVEQLPGGDPYRTQGTAFVGPVSLLFAALNTGKRSVALDLRTEPGRTAMAGLMSTADVFVQNARPGSLVTLGLDETSVRARYPRLVYASLSGFGEVGPGAGRGGFDLVLQAEAGLMSVTGDPAVGPVKIGVPMLDLGSAVCCVAGVLAALLQRGSTGAGTTVSSSLLEFALAGFTSTAASMLATGRAPGLLGSHSPTFAPYGAFRTARGSVVLAGTGSEELWHALCSVLGLEQLVDDPDYADNAARVAHRESLTAVLEERLGRADALTWMDRLTAAGVPVSMVHDPIEALTGPQARALGVLEEHTTQGVDYPAVAPPMSVGGRLSYPRSAPGLGEHTDEVLAEWAIATDPSPDGRPADGGGRP